MRILFISLFLLLLSIVGNAQVRVKLNYNKGWQLTTQDSAVFIRICIYDTTNASFAGPVSDFYRTGKPQMRGTYKLAMKEGEFTFFYDNGQIESTGNFESNNRTGIWKYFYRNGTQKMEVEFFPVLGAEGKIFFLNDSTGRSLLKNGTGKWIEEINYSDGGTALITGEYKNFERHGRWTFKVSNDKAIREEEFVGGKFKSGVIRGIATGRVKVDKPLEYGVYFPDKFYLTENFVARPGIDFKTYKALRFINPLNHRTIYNLPATKNRLNNGDSTAYTVVERPAAPPEGMGEFYMRVSKTLRYPDDARKKDIKGRVFVEFIVEKDGTLTDFKILKGIGGGCDEEAIRILKKYADQNSWIPGMQNGDAVRVRFVIPITFGLIR